MQPPAPTQISSSKAHHSHILRFRHHSPTLGNLPATFSIILPPTPPTQLPILYWLSGLTCTDENFVTKAGAAQHAYNHNVAFICPDTSPRDAKAPHEDESWDFGTGAGFYVDAVTKGYDKYQMESYVVRELPVVVGMAVKGLGESGKVGILGHSMGGMGALSLAFRNQGLYGSVSAIAPICNPVACPWGRKCYGGYLGEDVELWKKYDPCELVREKGRLYDDILLDQGDADSFLEEQLKPHTFVEACQSVGQKVTLRMRKGYDHSYFYIQTVLEEHVRFHVNALSK